jgi:hypothetical protein
MAIKLKANKEILKPELSVESKVNLLNGKVRSCDKIILELENRLKILEKRRRNLIRMKESIILGALT